MTRTSPSMTLILLASMLANLSWLAQAGPSAVLSRDELRKKLSVYRSITKLETTFVQKKTLKEIGVVIASEGKFTLIPPHRVIWEVTKPSPVKVTLDEKEIRIESGLEKEKTIQVIKTGESISDAAAAKLAASVGWLRLDADRLFDEYIVTSDQPRNFKFTPRDLSKSLFVALELRLSGEGYARSLTIYEKSGDLIEIDFLGGRVMHSGQ